MLIDWFTVLAQALNFLILVWLMKRFLYKPILRAIDEREKRIAAALADAAAKKAEAQKERDEFQDKNKAFDQQRAALVRQATDEANEERRRLLKEARETADAFTAKRQEALTTDAHHLNEAIRRRTQQEVLAIARKALTDLAAIDLEDRLCEVFARRLRAMDGRSKEALAQAINATSDAALVRSAFDLSADQRNAIQQALNETFSTEVPLRFETAPDLISGIQFTTHGQQIAWSIADYLASLGRGLDELLKHKAAAPAAIRDRDEPKPDTTSQ